MGRGSTEKDVTGPLRPAGQMWGFHRGCRPVRALVLTPTRELAAQVAESVDIYGRHLPLRRAVVFGGVKINPQIDRLRRGVDVLVATPGRLLDHVSQNTVVLSRVEILVLDEADRMLDMGFIRDIRRILGLLPAQRQNLLFSATFSDEIKRLADGLLDEPADAQMMNTLNACQRLDVSQTRVGRVSPRPCVAVASMEGVLVNHHLGEADRLLVYGEKEGRVQLMEARATPARGGGLRRWEALAESLSDCSTLLVSGVGVNPQRVLANAGIEVLEIEGLIDEALRAVFAGESLKHMTKRSLTACGSSCQGSGVGCS